MIVESIKDDSTICDETYKPTLESFAPINPPSYLYSVDYIPQTSLIYLRKCLPTLLEKNTTTGSLAGIKRELLVSLTLLAAARSPTYTLMAQSGESVPTAEHL